MRINPAKRARILTLSASKIALWYSCPMAFFLRYIEPQLDSKEAMVLTFGKASHVLLNRFYKVNYKSPESFAGYWKYYWFATCTGQFLKGKKKDNTPLVEYPMKHGDPLKLRGDLNAFGDPAGEFFGFMKLGERILKDFYVRHKPLPPPVEREKRRTIEIFGHKIIVVFDRVDKMPVEKDGKKEERWYITDYKTDKNCPDEDSFTLHRSPQFTIYSKAFRQIFNEEEKNILYYHLRSGKVLKTKRDQKDFDYLEQLLDRAHEEIERSVDSGKFVPFYGYRCKHCDYKLGCERYSHSYDGPKLVEDGKIIGAEEFTGWNKPEDLEEMLVDER